MGLVSSSDRFLPAGYVLLILDSMRSLGLPEKERATLLEHIGISEEQLHDPAARVGLEEVNHLLILALTHVDAYRLIETVGANMKLSSHGDTGFAVMTARNVREALEIAQRFISLRVNFVSLRLEVSHDTAHLFVDDTLHLHPLREALLLILAHGFYTMGRMATGQKLFARVDLNIHQPPGFESLASAGAGLIRFDQPFNRMSFSSAYLDYPLLMADPVAMRMTLERCEQELAMLGRERSFLGRVRHLLENSGQDFPDAETLAAQLNLSSRTLKRQLAQHHTSYSELLEETLRRRAVMLLEDHRLSLETISEKLGYSDPGNFTRAFKRWTGMSPRAYRQNRA